MLETTSVPGDFASKCMERVQKRIDDLHEMLTL